MKESVHHTFELPISPKEAYDSWLHSDDHSNMTGGEAHCSANVGDEFTAWDGYITGRNISLKPNEEIIQSWRTTEFDDTDEDSELSIQFSSTADGCEIRLAHTNIPEGQTQYERGWIDSYINPMKEYFAE